ncbi:probable protein phosphatase 2C 61 [Oryza brachyantha]|uniref:probable protein phosphatase 2C 61 n=1 Tax=Oryza brachyantha TaxID=4533 RepID=UPI001ADBF792|nr:probable protein phosphatase 2C 61 [Oryza brachyantha]
MRMARWCVGWPASATEKGCRDGLTWQAELRPHAAGEFSMAAAQANAEMEDQAQVMPSPEATLVGVYDGHGGPDASRFLRSRLFPLVHELAAEHGGAVTAEVMRKAFLAADEEYLQLLRWSLPNMSRAAASGSCCLLGAISDDTLYVANAGDSRAVLGRRAATAGRGQVVAERLSTEHNVASEEVRRELAALHPDDGEVVVHARGAWRVKGIIQVARSIGDVYLKTPEFRRDAAVQRRCSPRAVDLTRPVVTAEPSVHARKLKPGVDLFVVFASDGLWEHLSDDEAVRLVSKNPRRGVAGALVQAAFKEAARKREVRRGDLWRIERGVRRHFHDDIAAVVVFLDLDNDGRRARRRGKVVHSTSSCCSSNTPLDVYSFFNSGA